LAALLMEGAADELDRWTDPALDAHRQP